MSNVLFVNVFGYGHINPTISIVRELVGRGENVTYIADEEFKGMLERLDVNFIGYKNFDELEFHNGNINLECIEPQLFKIATVYKEIVDIIFSLNDKYDCLIYDSLFFIGNEVARALKVTSISSVSTFATNDKTDYLSMFINLCKPAVEKLLCRTGFIEIINYLWDKYKIITPDFFSLHTIKNDLNIVYTSKYFQISGDSFDDSYKFIGPSIVDSGESTDSIITNDYSSKIIYISLGTIFNNSIEFYESCFKAFKKMDASIIMSVGKNIDINVFKAIPPNFIVRNCVPQLEILKHADVFITHGGMNSTNEGLYYSVPLIVVPHFFDQYIVAQRVAELGAGVIIQKNKVTPKLLYQSVVSILSDISFKENSKKIGNSLREAGGYKKGVNEIFNIKNKTTLLGV